MFVTLALFPCSKPLLFISPLLPYCHSVLAEDMIRTDMVSMHELLLLLAALLSFAGLIPATPHDGKLDAELHRLHEAVGKDHELSLERRLDITARTASLIANHMFCKTGEVQGPSCAVLEKNGKQLEALKGWAIRSEGWERILASLSLFHVGRNYWHQENYDRSLLAVEQSIALKLFPYQTEQALEAWQRALVHPKSGYASQRQELADALVLQADCLLEMGQGDRNIAQLEKAMQALQLAAALVHNNKESTQDTYTHMTVMAMQIASAAVDVLNRLRMSSIHELMDTHGVTCKGCTDKGALLRQLVPRLNLPVVMLSSTSSLMSPIEDPLAHDILPTLKSPKETQQQYMQRQFRSLLGMVHNHLLEELQVSCARRTQEGFCASYLPPWTWEAGDDTGAATEASSCADPGSVCSGQCSSSRACSAAGSNLDDPDSSKWQQSTGGSSSDSTATVHLGGVDTIIFTSTGQGAKPGSPSDHDEEGQVQGAGFQGEEGAEDGGSRMDPKSARHFTSGNFHDAVRETLDRQLKDQLAKTADASSQHDDPLVLLTLLGCILACLGLYLYVKHKRRISRFLSSHKGWLSSTSNERSAGYASLGASGVNPTVTPSVIPSVAQSRKAIAASLREALAAGDVDRVQTVLGAAEEVGLEPTSSLLQKAQAMVQQRKRREKSQQQGSKGASNKKDKTRKAPKVSPAEGNGVLPAVKDKLPSLARVSISSSSPSEVPQHDPPLQDVTNAPPKPTGRLRDLLSLLSFKRARKASIPAVDSSSSPDGSSPKSNSPRSYSLGTLPVTSAPGTTAAADPDPQRPQKQSNSTKSSKAQQVPSSKPSSTTHSSDTEPVDAFPPHERHPESWRDPGKKTKQRPPDKSQSKRSRVTNQSTKAATNSPPLLSASILAQLPGSNYASPLGLFVASSDVSGTDMQSVQSVQPAAHTSSAAEPTSPQYPPSMPIPTPIMPSPAQSPAPSWMSWLSTTSNFAPVPQPTNPPADHTHPSTSLPPPLFSHSQSTYLNDNSATPPVSTPPGPLSTTLQYLGSDKMDIPGLLSSGALNPAGLSSFDFTTPTAMYTLDSTVPTTAPTARSTAAKAKSTTAKADRAASRAPAAAAAAGRPVLYSQVVQGSANGPSKAPTGPQPDLTPSFHENPDAAFSAYQPAIPAASTPQPDLTPPPFQPNTSSSFNTYQPAMSATSALQPNLTPPDQCNQQPSTYQITMSLFSTPESDLTPPSQSNPQSEPSTYQPTMSLFSQPDLTPRSQANPNPTSSSYQPAISAHPSPHLNFTPLSQANPEFTSSTYASAMSMFPTQAPNHTPSFHDTTQFTSTTYPPTMPVPSAPQFLSTLGPHSVSAQPFTPSSSQVSQPLSGHPASQLPLSLDDDLPASTPSNPLSHAPTEHPSSQQWNILQSQRPGMYTSTFTAPHSDMPMTPQQAVHLYQQASMVPMHSQTPPSLPHACAHLTNGHPAPLSPYPNQYTTRSEPDPSTLLPNSLSPLHANIPTTPAPRSDQPRLPNLPASLGMTHDASPLKPSNVPYPEGCFPDPAMAQVNGSLSWAPDAPIPNEMINSLGGSLWDPLVSFDMNSNEDAWSSNTRRLQEWLQVDAGAARGPMATAPVATGNECVGVGAEDVALGASPPDSLGDANEWIHDLLKHVMD